VDKTRIQPVGGNHAIEVMAIGIEWATPLDDGRLQALKDIYTESLDLRNTFPQFAPVQAFLIQAAHQFGAAGADSQSGVKPENVTPPQFLTTAAGFDARLIDSDGKISWVVSVRPGLLSCSCFAYDRWKNIKPKALDALRPFMAEVLKFGKQKPTSSEEEWSNVDSSAFVKTGSTFIHLQLNNRWPPKRCH